METHPDEPAILQALATLELKLTELIRNGIAQIQQEHNRALLKQARANATFADRERLGRMAIKLENVSQAVTGLHRQDSASADDRRSLRTAIERLDETVTTRTIHFYTGAAGYLITAAIVLSSSVMTSVLTHLWKW